MLAALVEARMDEQLNEALEECVLTDKGEHVFVAATFSGVKWYESYPDVAMHTALWDFFEDKHNDTVDSDGTVEGKFVRIGEDTGDIEEKAFGDGQFELYEIMNVQVSLAVFRGELFEPANDMRKK
jgi:hypothetical protein